MNTRSEVEFRVKGLSDLPADEEFRLSAFGLPEPVGVVWEAKRPWHIWLIGAAIAAGAMMLLLRWLRLRTAARKPEAAEGA